MRTRSTSSSEPARRAAAAGAMVGAGALQSRTLDDSPRMTAQQRKIDAAFGTVVSRRAKVKDFAARWDKGPLVDDADPATRGRNANLQIRVRAEFANDDAFTPADAEYRQLVKDKWEITAPGHRARVWSEKPAWEDDNYSRADDTQGRAKNEAVFATQDFPGWHHNSERRDQLLSTDTIAATFSAKQQIIDTSNEDAVIAEIPEHTATITGMHPRQYTGTGTQVVGVDSGEYD
ncbi:hypothetical protein [Piscinibacter sp.]|uniref:hypothetical protein n=1 Tax=Piscinibacter sp. TaxID=1903157 RepID=UPI002B9C45F7|nr:hypothetical protein [Albitalea sp.]HUG24379.1 hypothetical protein [Albitalea sp.]